MKINRHRCLLLGILFLVLSITVCYIGTFVFFSYFKIKSAFVGPATQIFFIIISLTDLVAGTYWHYYYSDMLNLWLILRPYVLILFYGGVFLLILRFIVKEEE